MIGTPAAGPIPLRMYKPTTRARSLLAFTGVAPLGAFVVVHLVTTATALSGPARFERVFAESPVLADLTFVVVVLPLLFHAAYGGWLAITRPRPIELPTWWPRLRRLSSLAVLAFVAGHLIEVGGPRLTGVLPASSLLDAITAQLSSTTAGVPWVALGYVVGLAATLFHLAVSFWTFLTTWGLVTLRRRALAWGLGVGGGLLFLLGMNTIVYLATGNRLFGPPAPAFVPDGPPPAPCASQP